MWIANLSNGTVVTEKEPPPGEVSTWRKLLQYCRESGVKITGMRLTDNQRIMVSAMPHTQCDGYYQAYEEAHFLYNRQLDYKRQGIGSVIGEYVYITWIEEAPNNLTYVFSDVRTLRDSLANTTIR